MKNKFTKPIVALAALGVIGAGAGAGALASAQTAATGATAQTAPGDHLRMPGVHGTITAINGTTVTVSDQRSGTSYTVDASAASVMKGSQGSAPAASSVSALAVGDMVGVEGTVSGTSVTATKILSGFMGGRGGFGHGRGTAGTVTAVSGNTITITGDNGTSYTVDASGATVSKMMTIGVADIKVGDRIGAEGTLSGTNVAATRIMDGIPAKPAEAAGN